LQEAELIARMQETQSSKKVFGNANANAIDPDEINFGLREEDKEDDEDEEDHHLHDIEEDHPSYLNAHGYLQNKSGPGPGEINRSKSKEVRPDSDTSE
jgi:hypothetical protein